MTTETNGLKMFESETLGASFKLPERPTVRQQLAYFSATAYSVRKSMIERKWDGALALMSDWQCEALPDPAVDLDTVTSARATDAILWASMQAQFHIERLEDVEKNS